MSSGDERHPNRWLGSSGESRGSRYVAHSPPRCAASAEDHRSPAPAPTAPRSTASTTTSFPRMVMRTLASGCSQSARTARTAAAAPATPMARPRRVAAAARHRTKNPASACAAWSPATPCVTAPTRSDAAATSCRATLQGSARRSTAPATVPWPAPHGSLPPYSTASLHQPLWHRPLHLPRSAQS